MDIKEAININIHQRLNGEVDGGGGGGDQTYRERDVRTEFPPLLFAMRKLEWKASQWHAILHIFREDFERKY